jgi:hypothetical protein
VYTFQLTTAAVVFCLSFVYSPLINIRRGLVCFLTLSVVVASLSYSITLDADLCVFTSPVIVASLSYSITLDADLCFFTAFEPTNEERLGTALFKPNTYLTIATHNTSERKRPCAPSGAFV